MQTPSQHAPAVAQAAPAGSHAWSRQVPLLQMEEQQSPATSHSAPSGSHAASPQALCVQAPEQHGDLVWQRNPSGWQALPQKPPLQGRLQQSPSPTHTEPCGLHCAPPQ